MNAVAGTLKGLYPRLDMIFVDQHLFAAHVAGLGLCLAFIVVPLALVGPGA